jgi:hypothetical protein
MRKHVLTLCLLLFVTLCGARGAWAQLTSGTPDPSSTQTNPSGVASGASAGGSPFAGSPGDTKQSLALALGGLTTVVASVISAATTLSTSIQSESNKFAYGLGVITIVLAAIRFAGSHHPVSAWTALFEELGMLAIFAALYLSYSTVGPGIYTWFTSLATKIGGATSNTSLMSTWGATTGSLGDAVLAQFKATPWYEIPSLVAADIWLIFAWIVMLLTAVVYTFFTNMGEIQAALGIVVGQIAIALGFSSYTRSYFKTWLDYMISAGMYCVVAAIMSKLVAQVIITDLTTKTAGGTTTQATAIYCFCVSIFLLLISLEIPKIAGAIFGGGASAGGVGPSMVVKAAKGAASLIPKP